MTTKHNFPLVDHSPKQSFFWSTGEVSQPATSLADQARAQHYQDVARESAAQFETALTHAENMTAKFDLVHQFISDRHQQTFNAHMDDVYSDYATAYSTFTAYKTVYNQAGSLYLRRLLEWGMNKEIHEIAGWQYGEGLYDVRPDIDWDDWFYGFKTAGHVDATLSEVAKGVLVEHPEYKEMFEYGLKLAAEQPQLGSDDHYAPSPYRSLVAEMAKQSTRDSKGQLSGIHQELAIETSSLFGVAIDDISEPARKQLVEYGLMLDEANYVRLKKVSQRLASTKARVQLAEAFLATEFGDDYGDRIMSIAEHATPKQAEKIFELSNTAREGANAIAGWFDNIDSQFAGSARHGMQERLVDALVAVDETVKHGSLEVNVAPNGGRSLDDKRDERFLFRRNSPEEAIDAMDKLSRSLDGIGSIISAPDTVVTRVVQKNQNFSMYRFLNAELGVATLYIRPEGTLSRGDADYEWGSVKKGVEASFGFRYNPDDPFGLDNGKDVDAVNIRFDREGRSLGESPNSESRSTIRSDGMISVDISSVIPAGRLDGPSVVTGQFVAAGNVIRANERGETTALHHNPLDNQRYGNAGRFAALARSVDQKAEQLAGRTDKRKLGRIALQLRAKNQPDYPAAAA